MEQLAEQLSKFIRLDADTAEALVSLFGEEQLKKNDFLAQSGEYSKKIAFVKSGILRAFYQNNAGEQYNKTFFKTNDFVGAYSSLVTGQQNLIDIQCLTDCTLFVADYQRYTKLYDRFPAIERLSRILAEQFFVQKEKREIELVLLEAKERYKIFQAEHPNLEQHIPQYHIASYLGVTPTQLSRIRAQK